MAANSRLTIATHSLAWLALARRRGYDVLSSEQVAASVHTNPVVIRRCLGELRRAGLVSVSRGAGWSLAREPHDITLLDVYDAIGAGSPFGLHHTEPNLECPVGRGIRPVLRHVYQSVDGAVHRELERVTIADVLRETLRA